MDQINPAVVPLPEAESGADLPEIKLPKIFAGAEVVDLEALAQLDRNVDIAVLGDTPTYSLIEAAPASGWTLEELQKISLWAGLPAPDPQLRIYSQKEIDGFTHLKEVCVAENLDEDALRNLLRSISSSLERLAMWWVEAFTEHLVKSRGMTDTQARVQALIEAPPHGRLLLSHINNIWLRHYAAAVHRLTTEAIVRRGVSDDATFPLLSAVGVARMANFIERTRDLNLVDFAEYVKDFHHRVADIVNHLGGRVVNNIGDFVMFVAGNPATGAEIALALAAMTDAHDDAEIQVALGWGRVMSFQGDIYGPGVTLVFLISRETPAGQVYLEPDAAAALARNQNYVLTEQPEIEVRGLGAVNPTLLQRAKPEPE